MQVVYSGAHPEVVVDAISTDQVITRGTPVTVPDDIGESLIEQDTWAKVDQPASTPSATATAPTTPVSTPDAVSAAPVASPTPTDDSKAN